MAAIQIRGIDEVVKALGELEAVKLLKPALEQAVRYIRSEAAIYPPAFKFGPKVRPFSTLKQQRWFFAALKSGEVVVPYRRTRTLGRTWTTKVEADPGLLRGTVGNNTEYAPWVMADEKGSDGRGPQSKRHEGTWMTVGQITADVEPNVQKIFEKAIDAALAKW